MNAPATGNRPAGNEPARRLAVSSLLLFVLSLATEYRFRIGVSLSVPEVAGYLLLLATLRLPRASPPPPGSAALWICFCAFTLALLSRGFVFSLFRMPDQESPWSRVRDAGLPVLLVLVVRDRLRLDGAEYRRVALAMLLSGLVGGALGIIQFRSGGPFLVQEEGINDFVEYKTAVAQKYYLAQLLHLEVKQLARGAFAFSISYAASLVVPCTLAFSYLFEGPRRQKVFAAGVFLVIFSGMYLSFSRSILAVMPFGGFLALRVLQGKLRPWTCAAVALGYVGVAFVLPALHLGGLDGKDMGTLNERGDTVSAYFQQVRGNPGALYFGTTLAKWKEWHGLAPHNWLVNALMTDGAAATALRLSLYLGCYGVLFPVRRGQSTDPLRAGLWAGSYTLLMVVGETEPFSGISEHLLAGSALAILAATEESARDHFSAAWK